MRIVCCGLLLAAVAVTPAAAQSPSANPPATASESTNVETRPALPTFFGDTGLWFVPTAETLAPHKPSVQVFRNSAPSSTGLTGKPLLSGLSWLSYSSSGLSPDRRVWSATRSRLSPGRELPTPARLSGPI